MNRTLALACTLALIALFSWQVAVAEEPATPAAQTVVCEMAGSMVSKKGVRNIETFIGEQLAAGRSNIQMTQGTTTIFVCAW